MIRDRPKPAAARHGLLPVLMLAVLAASVGAAWMLYTSANRRVGKGSEILDHIRSEGLSDYWPDRVRINWYLIRSGDGVIGWRAEARGRTPEGGFIGAYVVAVRGQSRYWANSMLNAEATAGSYRAGGRLAGIGTFETRIGFIDGKVTVIRAGARVGVSSSTVPGNYLPEGMFLPVIRRVAAERADAQFAMVFDEVPDRSKVAAFGTVRFRYVGQGMTPDKRPVQRVRLDQAGLGRKESKVYEIDRQGDVLRILSGQDIRWIITDEQTVSRTFSRAPVYLWQTLPEALRQELRNSIPAGPGPASSAAEAAQHAESAPHPSE